MNNLKQSILQLIDSVKRKTIESFLISLQNPQNIKMKPLIQKIIERTNYLPNESSLKERVYHILNDINETNRPKCKKCDNYTKFLNFTKGYQLYCSNKCRQLDSGKILGNYSKTHANELLEKRIITNLKKYGVDNVSKIPQVNKKKSDTWKSKTEKDLETINQKRTAVFLENYGVTNPNKTTKTRDKIKETNLKKFGVTTNLNTESCRSKTIKAIITKMPEIMKKRINTNLERYGVEHFFQSDESKEKSRKTNLEKYGVDNPAKSEIIYQKIINTNLERYGVKHPLQSEEIQKNLLNTLKQKYGVHNVSQIESVREEKQRKFFNILLNSDRLKKHYLPNFDIDAYTNLNAYYEWKCLKCNTIFQYNIKNGRIPRCPKCYPIYQVSLAETDLDSFCQEHFDVIYRHPRNIIQPYEIDIYIPQIKLGVIFNNIYWHSEIAGKKDPDYHQNKLLLALQKEIQLIQIFEDEWRDKKEIVKSILLNKFLKNQKKIFARKCSIVSVSNSEAEEFYFNNHIQGHLPGKHVGLAYENELVSLMTMGQPRFNQEYDLEIYRFCNKLNISVIGGLSRLLKAFIDWLHPKSIITYVDARYGLGIGYFKCGFNFKEVTAPNYYYIKYYNDRLTRYQFQKHLLKNKLKDFDPTLTEWENMQLNGYDRIWDCGNIVYDMNLK